nr:LRR receptor-like serine/threonine-protein kinase RGI5 [Ziziphus jujuba var. spinosa]
MAYNQLSDRVPNSFRFNKESIVNLSTNRFQGPLPIWSSNITIFSLKDNMFSEPIPPNIGEAMPLLSDLDISENSLTGCIPLSIGNVTGLTTSIISNNKLSGELPSSLQNCTNMVNLDLGDKRFTGQIPSSIGNLEWIETLDISMNHISGPIPFLMTSLTFLNHLNLSYNNLSGKIPTTNQFLTLDDPSIYQGNASLCGRPLLTECPNHSGQSKLGGDEEDGDGDGDGGDKFEKLGLIINIVIGFFMGFLGVCGTLIVKRSWRIAYFRFADRVKSVCLSMF